MEQRRIIMLALLVLVVGSLVLIVLLPGDDQERQRTGETIALINVYGAITDTDAGGFFDAATPARRIQNELRQARQDNRVRAVVLRVNSPGGSAAAADEISREIQRLRDDGKPVVVSVGESASSGAYWIAAQADQIIASPVSVTGSIGVIYQSVHLTGLYEMLGIDVEVITTGPFKDTGAPHRDLRDDEREFIEELLDDTFNQFVDAITAGRNMDRDAVLAVADGRVFTGRQALELGLIDGFGNLYDAADVAAELAEIDQYRLVPMSEPTFFERFFGPLARVMAEGLRDGLGLNGATRGGIQP